MTSYIIHRLLLMLPTIWGVLTITFVIIQFVPGGPLAQIRYKLEQAQQGGEVGAVAEDMSDARRGGLSDEHYQQLKRVYNLDRPLWERYVRTFAWFSADRAEESLPRALLNRDNWEGMLVFKFGDSFYRNKNVLGLIKEKLPVSVSLGVWSFFLSYSACIILGIAKAVREGTRFDTWSSVIVLIGYSVPGFVLAVLIIVLFGPGDAALVRAVPLSGLSSAGVFGYENWPWWQKVLDYLHHTIAPVFCLSTGSFAVLTILTKNAFLEEMRKQYVITAHAKGLSRKRVLYGHILRNAMIPLITGFPSRFLAMFFTGALLIEKIFNLDGMGLLAYTSVIQRDYPVVMGTLFVTTLIGVFGQLLCDISYVIVDRRISFEKNAAAQGG